jgi:hypothetical protein
MKNKSFNTYLQIKFNNYNFYYDAIAIDDILFPTFVGTILKFEKALYTYNNDSDSVSATSYENKEYGLFLLKDKINNSEYLINK